MNDGVGNNHLSRMAREFFTKLGSTEISQLGHQDSWAFVGVNDTVDVTEERKT